MDAPGFFFSPAESRPAGESRAAQNGKAKSEIKSPLCRRRRCTDTLARVRACTRLLF